MKLFSFFFIFILSSIVSWGQTIDNFKIPIQKETVKNWDLSEEAHIDDIVTRNGNNSIRISGIGISYATTKIPIEVSGSVASIYGEIMTKGLQGKIELGVRAYSGEKIDDPYYHISETTIVIEEEKEEWSKFHIDVELCPEITTLYFIAALNGMGEIWLSDINVRYTVKNKAQKKDKLTYPAQDDHRFKKNSAFVLPEDIDAQTINNLWLTSKVWGFLKYYHPAVRNGQYNWDNELFALLPAIYDTSPAERNSLLNEWINGLGSYISTDTPEVPAQLRWVYDTELLGEQLSRKLVEIAHAHRGPFCYYASPYISIGTIVAKNEVDYKKFDYTDDGIRLLAMFRLWNFVEYFYPYRDLITDWNGVLSENLPIMAHANTESEYYAALCLVVKALHNSHCAVGPPTTLKKLVDITKKYKYTAGFIPEQYMDDRLWVTFTFGNGEKDLQIGDAIISVNNQKVEEYLTEKLNLTSYSNFNNAANDHLYYIGFNDSPGQILLTLDRDGEIMDIQSELMPFMKARKLARKGGSKELPIVMFDGKRMENYDIIGDSITYVNAGKISDAELQKIFLSYPQNYTKHIIDFRGYPESHHLFEYLSQFIPDMRLATRLIFPDLKTPGKFHEKTGMYFGAGKDIPDHEIVVLVDEKAQSHSEYCVKIIQQAPKVTTIGTPTSGADGNVTYLGLPGKYRAMLGGIGVKYPDGTQTEQVGVRIDHIIKKELSQYRKNSDSVIEAAVSLLTN